MNKPISSSLYKQKSDNVTDRSEAIVKSLEMRV